MTVNLEGFILLNVLMNMLALMSAARLCGLRSQLWRMACVSCAGAVYGVAAYLPGLDVLQGAPKLAFPFVMGAAAFRCSGVKTALKASLWVCVSTFLLGGLGYGMMHIWGMTGYGLPIVAVTAVLGATACFALLWGIRRAHELRRAVTVRIMVSGECLQVQGIIDTGNALVEPLSGLPVVMLDKRALPEGVRLPHKRPVPFTSIGGGGLAEGFMPDALFVDSKAVKPAYVALTERLDGDCAALVPPGIVREEQRMYVKFI